MVFHRNTGFPFFCAFPEFLSRMVGMDFRILSCVPGVFFCLNIDVYKRQVVRTVNQGTARARETGIRHAQGDYICFLDGDDVWDSRMLEKLVAAIGENGGYDIVCCDYKRICKTYEAPRREMRTSDMQGLDFLVASLYHAISVTVWGRLYRRALFEKELRHYPLRLGEDSLLNIQIGCQQPRVRFIDYVGYGLSLIHIFACAPAGSSFRP